MIVIDNKVEKSECLDYINDCLVYIEDYHGDKFEIYVFQDSYGMYIIEFYILRDYIEKLSDGKLSSTILKIPYEVGTSSYYHNKLYQILTSDLESLLVDIRNEFNSNKFKFSVDSEFVGDSSYVTWNPSITMRQVFVKNESVQYDSTMKETPTLDYIKDCLVYLDDNWDDIFEFEVGKVYNTYKYTIRVYLNEDYVKQFFNITDGYSGVDILKNPPDWWKEKFSPNSIMGKKMTEHFNRTHKVAHEETSKNAKEMIEDFKKEFNSNKFICKYIIVNDGSDSFNEGTPVLSVDIEMKYDNNIVKTFEGWKNDMRPIIEDWKDKIEYILLPMMDNLKLVDFLFDGEMFQCDMHFKFEDLDFVEEELIKMNEYFDKVDVIANIYMGIINKNEEVEMIWSEFNGNEETIEFFKKFKNEEYKTYILKRTNGFRILINIHDDSPDLEINF